MPEHVLGASQQELAAGRRLPVREIRYDITQGGTQSTPVIACQHITSSAFSLGVAVPETGFRLASGEPRALRRNTDSGRLNTRFVCADCASWLYSQLRGGLVRVRAGSLDDRSWLRPTRHLWTRSKQPWITFVEGDEIFELKAVKSSDTRPIDTMMPARASS